MAKILDGKALAETVKNELKDKIENWVKLGKRAPSLRCIFVGDDQGSESYVNNIKRQASNIGINAQVLRYESTITEAQLIQEIKTLNDDSTVDAILIQLPVPDTMNERNVCNAISPEKDVDGFHIMNIGQLCVDMPSFVPATALAVIEILKRSEIETFGRNAVVANRSKNIGLPIAMILHSDKRHENGLGMDATVTICHRYTPPEQLKVFCQNADIIITATGIPKLIKANMIKPGATVIDVGMTKVIDENGKAKFVGDVDYEEVVKIAGAVTPVPGGVGPMTVAMLLHNTFQAAKQLRNKV
ncbi:hypothetical protein PYW08_002851 [Mythimna loreyi]|uniref:Uncharacterized protein n=1 Tax=Mythimna loreyi TaxID=667449 RepID=A0ACC2QJM4_9NEOP|nr:hypothetical protein PYW08_002851 [Mythimna loreyi]